MDFIKLLAKALKRNLEESQRNIGLLETEENISIQFIVGGTVISQTTTKDKDWLKRVYVDAMSKQSETINSLVERQNTDELLQPNKAD